MVNTPEFLEDDVTWIASETKDILFSFTKKQILRGVRAFIADFFDLCNLIARSRMEEEVRKDIDWISNLDCLIVHQVPSSLPTQWVQEVYTLRGILGAREGNFHTVVHVNTNDLTEEQARNFLLRVGEIVFGDTK